MAVKYSESLLLLLPRANEKNEDDLNFLCASLTGRHSYTIFCSSGKIANEDHAFAVCI